MDTSSRPPEVVVISTPAASSDGVCQSPASEGDVSASGSEARKEASSLSAKRNNGGLPSRSPSPSSEQSCKTNKKVRTSSTNDEAKDTIPRGRTHAATGTSLSSPSSSRTATKMIQSSSSSPSSSSLALPSSASTGANGTSPTSSAMEASSRSTSPRETSTTTTAARTVNKRGGRSPGDALQPPTSGHCSTSTSACPPSTVTTSPSQQQQHHTPQSREIVLIRKFTLDQFQQRLQDLRSRRGLIQVFNFRDTVLPSAYCMALFFSTAASAPQLTKFLMYYLEKMPASQFRVLCAGITKCRHLRHVDANATGASGLSAWRTLLLLKQLRTLPDIRHVTLSGNELENYCTRRPSYKKNGAGGRRGKKGRGVKQNHVAAATTKQQKKQEDDKKEDSEMKTEKGSEKDGAEESKEGKLCNGCEESGTSVDSEELSEQERVEEEDEWGKTEDYAITEGPDDEDDCLVKEEGPIKSRRVSKKDDEGVDDVGEPVPELLSSGENTGDEAFFDRDERQGQKEGQEQEEEVEEDIEASAKVLLREVRQSVIVGRRRARRRRRRGEDDEQEDGRVALIDEEGPVSLLQDLLLRGVICLQIKECSLIEQTRLAVWVLNVCHLLRLRQLDLGRSNKSLAETMPDEPVLLSNGELLRRVCLMSRPLWRRRMRSSDILTPFHALDDWQEWMLPYFWLYALLDCMLLYGHNRRKALPADTGDDSKKTSYSNGAKDVDHSLAGEKDKSGRGVPTLAKVPPAPLSSSSPPSSSHSRVRGDGGASSLLQHSSLQRYPLVRVWAVPGASFPLGGAGLRLPPGCAGFCYALLIGRVGDRCLVEWLSRSRFLALLEKDMKALSEFEERQRRSVLSPGISADSPSASNSDASSSSSATSLCSCSRSHRPLGSTWPSSSKHSAGSPTSAWSASATSSLFLSHKLLTPPFSRGLKRMLSPGGDDSSSDRNQYFTHADRAMAWSRPSGRTSSRRAAVAAAAAVASHAVASASPSYTWGVGDPHFRLTADLQELFGIFDDVVHISRVEPAAFAWHWCEGSAAANSCVSDSPVKTRQSETETEASSGLQGREATAFPAAAHTVKTTVGGASCDAKRESHGSLSGKAAMSLENPKLGDDRDTCGGHRDSGRGDLDHAKMTPASTDDGLLQRNEKESHRLPFGVGSWVEVDLGGKDDAGKFFFTAIGIVCQIESPATAPSSILSHSTSYPVLTSPPSCAFNPPYAEAVMASCGASDPRRSANAALSPTCSLARLKAKVVLLHSKAATTSLQASPGGGHQGHRMGPGGSKGGSSGSSGVSSSNSSATKSTGSGKGCDSGRLLSVFVGRLRPLQVLVPPPEWTMASLREQVLRVRYQAEKEKGERRLWGFGGPAGSCVLLPKELGIQANKTDFGASRVFPLPLTKLTASSFSPSSPPPGPLPLVFHSKLLHFFEPEQLEFMQKPMRHPRQLIVHFGYDVPSPASGSSSSSSPVPAPANRRGRRPGRPPSAQETETPSTAGSASDMQQRVHPAQAEKGVSSARCGESTVEPGISPAKPELSGLGEQGNPTATGKAAIQDCASVGGGQLLQIQKQASKGSGIYQAAAAAGWQKGLSYGEAPGFSRLPHTTELPAVPQPPVGFVSLCHGGNGGAVSSVSNPVAANHCKKSEGGGGVSAGSTDSKFSRAAESVSSGKSVRSQGLGSGVNSPLPGGSSASGLREHGGFSHPVSSVEAAEPPSSRPQVTQDIISSDESVSSAPADSSCVSGGFSGSSKKRGATGEESCGASSVGSRSNRAARGGKEGSISVEKGGSTRTLKRQRLLVGDAHSSSDHTRSPFSVGTDSRHQVGGGVEQRVKETASGSRPSLPPARSADGREAASSNGEHQPSGAERSVSPGPSAGSHVSSTRSIVAVNKGISLPGFPTCKASVLEERFKGEPPRSAHHQTTGEAKGDDPEGLGDSPGSSTVICVEISDDEDMEEGEIEVKPKQNNVVAANIQGGKDLSQGNRGGSVGSAVRPDGRLPARPIVGTLRDSVSTREEQEEITRRSESRREGKSRRKSAVDCSPLTSEQELLWRLSLPCPAAGGGQLGETADVELHDYAGDASCDARVVQAREHRRLVSLRDSQASACAARPSVRDHYHLRSADDVSTDPSDTQSSSTSRSSSPPSSPSMSPLSSFKLRFSGSPTAPSGPPWTSARAHGNPLLPPASEPLGAVEWRVIHQALHLLRARGICGLVWEPSSQRLSCGTGLLSCHEEGEGCRYIPLVLDVFERERTRLHSRGRSISVNNSTAGIRTGGQQHAYECTEKSQLQTLSQDREGTGSGGERSSVPVRSNLQEKKVFWRLNQESLDRLRCFLELRLNRLQFKCLQEDCTYVGSPSLTKSDACGVSCSSSTNNAAASRSTPPPGGKEHATKVVRSAAINQGGEGAKHETDAGVANTASAARVDISTSGRRQATESGYCALPSVTPSSRQSSSQVQRVEDPAGESGVQPGVRNPPRQCVCFDGRHRCVHESLRAPSEPEDFLTSLLLDPPSLGVRALRRDKRKLSGSDPQNPVEPGVSFGEARAPGSTDISGSSSSASCNNGGDAAAFAGVGLRPVSAFEGTGQGPARKRARSLKGAGFTQQPESWLDSADGTQQGEPFCNNFELYRAFSDLILAQLARRQRRRRQMWGRLGSFGWRRASMLGHLALEGKAPSRGEASWLDVAEDEKADGAEELRCDWLGEAVDMRLRGALKRLGVFSIERRLRRDQMVNCSGIRTSTGNGHISWLGHDSGTDKMPSERRRAAYALFGSDSDDASGFTTEGEDKADPIVQRRLRRERRAAAAEAAFHTEEGAATSTGPLLTNRHFLQAHSSPSVGAAVATHGGGKGESRGRGRPRKKPQLVAGSLDPASPTGPPSMALDSNTPRTAGAGQCSGDENMTHSATKNAKLLLGAQTISRGIPARDSQGRFMPVAGSCEPADTGARGWLKHQERGRAGSISGENGGGRVRGAFPIRSKSDETLPAVMGGGQSPKHNTSSSGTTCIQQGQGQGQSERTIGEISPAPKEDPLCKHSRGGVSSARAGVSDLAPIPMVLRPHQFQAQAIDACHPQSAVISGTANVVAKSNRISVPNSPIPSRACPALGKGNHLPGIPTSHDISIVMPVTGRRVRAHSAQSSASRVPVNGETTVPLLSRQCSGSAFHQAVSEEKRGLPHAEQPSFSCPPVSTVPPSAVTVVSGGSFTGFPRFQPSWLKTKDAEGGLLGHTRAPGTEGAASDESPPDRPHRSVPLVAPGVQLSAVVTRQDQAAPLSTKIHVAPQLLQHQLQQIASYQLPVANAQQQQALRSLAQTPCVNLHQLARQEGFGHRLAPPPPDQSSGCQPHCSSPQEQRQQGQLPHRSPQDHYPGQQEKDHHSPAEKKPQQQEEQQSGHQHPSLTQQEHRTHHFPVQQQQQHREHGLQVPAQWQPTQPLAQHKQQALSASVASGREWIQRVAMAALYASQRRAQPQVVAPGPYSTATTSSATSAPGQGSPAEPGSGPSGAGDAAPRGESPTTDVGRTVANVFSGPSPTALAAGTAHSPVSASNSAMATSPVEWHQPTHRDNAAATGDGSGEARDSVVRSDKTEGQRSTAEEQEDELSRPREAGKEGNEPPNSAPHVIDLTEDE